MRFEDGTGKTLLLASGASARLRITRDFFGRCVLRPWYELLLSGMAMTLLSFCFLPNADLRPLQQMMLFLFVFLAVVQCQTIVSAPAGSWRGEDLAESIAFRGIRYAQPPLGQLRFAQPLPYPAFTETVDAASFGPSCIQPPSASLPTYSEDCLSLNIWRPRSNVSNLPVMFWIHGGAFVTGGSASPTYDGERLASRGDSVIVTINYRLGDLGFLALPFGTTSDAANGAWGFTDQQLALKWVQQNIAAFGGDPSRVTLWGESAGAASVTLHTITPSSWPYFHQALFESSPAFAQTAELDTKLRQGRLVATYFSCFTLACMRNIAAADLAQMPVSLLQGTPTVAYGGGGVIPVSPWAALNSGAFHPGLMMGGFNRDEGTLFVYSALSEPLSANAYRLVIPPLLRFLLGVPIRTALRMVDEVYPCASYDPNDCRVAASKLVGDGLIECVSLMTLSARTSPMPFVYEYAHTDSFGIPVLGAYHSAELPYVFDTLASLQPNATQAELKLATDMSNSWLAFATNSNPSIPQQPIWTAGAPPARMELRTGTWTTIASPNPRCELHWFPEYTAQFGSLAGLNHCADDYALCNPGVPRITCCSRLSVCRRHASGCNGTVTEQYRCVPSGVDVSFLQRAAFR